MDDRSGVHVIATTISGSIKDWGKIQRIVPLFRQHGREDVELHVADSHAAARRQTRDLVAAGCRQVISAGGSGTFNAVLEGCIDAGVGLGDVALGFLRKGSADLIGKTLGMPDDIEEAVDVFVRSLATGSTVRCDVIRARSEAGDSTPRHFVGYGGAEIFGRVPHYTENRFIKYYKGVLSQLFGDLGPFTVGFTLAALERLVRGAAGSRTVWRVTVDGVEQARDRYQALILVNGDLGKDLPFAHDVPLGSGDFHLFGLRDVGALKVLGQIRRGFDGSIQDDPARWGFEHYRVGEALSLAPVGGGSFPVNIDGSTMRCHTGVSFGIVDHVRLMAP
ncbi:MAG: diacylglycerol kinase family protein [Gemmatimonadota bacterium]|jgi:diacylglycerol kinase family enzyme